MQTRRTMLMATAGLILGTTVKRAWAKRVAPPEVKPVEMDGVIYSAHHGRGDDGKAFVASIEGKPKDGKAQAWRKEIYRIVYNQNLEKDVQEKFITKLTASPNDGKLLIDAERGRQFTLDVKTLEVVEVKPSR
ncbi:MAG: hypothetical protein GC159_19405 [Phycisphaera sp.]|nr:hypothetical protein [Phycisphaera sp.]